MLADLSERRPEPEDVDGELDLAWWTSVLETIIRSDPRLAQHDPAQMRTHVETLRDGHSRLLTARAAQTVATVALRAVDAVAAYPDQVRWLLSEVHRAHRSSWPMDMFARAGDVVKQGQVLAVLEDKDLKLCLLYTSPSPRDRTRSRMPSSA